MKFSINKISVCILLTTLNIANYSHANDKTNNNDDKNRCVTTLETGTISTKPILIKSQSSTIDSRKSEGLLTRVFGYWTSDSRPSYSSNGTPGKNDEDNYTIEELKARREELKRQEEEREKAQQAKRAELLSRAKELINKNSGKEKQFVLDNLTYNWIKSMSGLKESDSGIYALLAGDLKNAQLSQTERSRIDSAISVLINQGWFVIYDADSNYASYIRNKLGSRGMGISGQYQDLNSDSPVVMIDNDYIRMTAFASANAVGAVIGNVVAAGLIVNEDLDHFVSGDKEGKDFQEPFYWDPPFTEPNLGLRMNKRLNWMSVSKKKGYIPKRFSANTQLELLSASELEGLLADAKQMTDFENSMKYSKSSNISVPTGAVVFGSSGYPGKHTDKVYQIVKKLSEIGVPISTGGAGGVMEIANQAAFDAGGESIGINLGGRLNTERESKTSIQTRAFSVSGYSMRIPLLLLDRPMIVVAPGGGGTMKELATSLVSIAADPNDKRVIVFLGQSYYEKLFSGLMSVLPNSVKERFFLIDTPEDITALVHLLKTNFWSADEFARFTNGIRPTPRNDNSSFEERNSRWIKSSRGSERDWDDYGDRD